MVERRSVKPIVPGSSPGRGAKLNIDMSDINWGIINIQELKNSEGFSLYDTISSWNSKHVVNPTKSIAFIGDSYCAELNSEHKRKGWDRLPDGRRLGTWWPSWPEIVAKHFNAEILQIGFAGNAFVTSFYSAYMKHPHWGYKSIIEKADIIIVCVSAPERLPNSYGLPASSNLPSQRYRDVKHLPKKYLEAVRQYYDHLFLGNFHYIGQKGALRELDDMIVEDQVIVWLPCFKESMCDYIPKNGVIGNLELFEIFQRDANRIHGTNIKNILSLKDEGPTMSNHMAKDSQAKLAKYLIDYINGAGLNEIPITEILNE